jgi:hypothetical protein
MAKESTSGIGVDTRYGPVSIPDGAVGTIKTAGGLNQLVAEFSGQNLIDSVMDNLKVIIPPNALPVRAYFECEEAFSLSGTLCALGIGTQGSIGTNGVNITGSAISVAMYTGVLKGTWSTGFTATTTVAVGVVNGAAASQGKGRFVVEYLKV